MSSCRRELLRAGTNRSVRVGQAERYQLLSYSGPFGKLNSNLQGSQPHLRRTIALKNGCELTPKECIQSRLAPVREQSQDLQSIETHVDVYIAGISAPYPPLLPSNSQA